MMRKMILTLALLAPALASAQTYEPDGAIRSMSQTHVWNSGSSAWDKWEGLVSATQSGTWTVQQGGAPWSVSQSGTWNIGTLTSITNPVAVTGTFWPTTAGAPLSARFSDGAAFYDVVKTGQLPAALVGGRLDVNLGAWLGSTAPTVGQKTMANSLPVAIASDQGAIPVTPGTVSALRFVLNTGGAGTTTVAAASPGNRHKILGFLISANNNGTFAFNGSVTGLLTGQIRIFNNTAPYAVPTSSIPYVVTGVNEALEIIVTGGATDGVIIYVTEP